MNKEQHALAVLRYIGDILKVIIWGLLFAVMLPLVIVWKVLAK